MPENGISVVCPTYNSSKYIRRALDTLTAQHHFPEQVIFSDDGSEDDTTEQILASKKDFQNKGIELVLLRNKHQGPGAARNFGILAASQPWIAFLDSDDTWKPNKLKRIRETIEENSKLNFFLHWEEYLRMDGSTRQLKHGEHIDPNGDLPLQLYQNNFLSTSAVVCRRSLIEQSGLFDASLPNGQDYELWLRMSPWLKLKILPELLGVYIEEPNSITARPYYKKLPAEIKISWRHRDKSSIFLFIIKFVRLFVNKQWIKMMLQFLRAKKGHDW
jgi:glycosyltransferase involved in cell wall biosynthesis